jgi:imidazolonepropionase-like amidohydrolase
MQQHGVRMLAGTDIPEPYVVPGFSLHDELVLLVRAGLSPMQALQAATRNPAEALGALSERGTVEPGKIADLVLLDADPLEDIGNTSRIATVILRGQPILKASLDSMSSPRQQTGR